MVTCLWFSAPLYLIIQLNDPTHSLYIGDIHSSSEGYCSRKNEWLEKALSFSTWKKDGASFTTVHDQLFNERQALTWYSFQVEMTGDYTPDMVALLSADIIISTPEKWDGISRNWQSRGYVTKVPPWICQLVSSLINVMFLTITVLNVNNVPFVLNSRFTN